MKYVGPIEWNRLGDTSFRAISVKDGMLPSTVSTTTFRVNGAASEEPTLHEDSLEVIIERKTYHVAGGPCTGKPTHTLRLLGNGTCVYTRAYSHSLHSSGVYVIASATSCTSQIQIRMYDNSECSGTPLQVEDIPSRQIETCQHYGCEVVRDVSGVAKACTPDR